MKTKIVFVILLILFLGFSLALFAFSKNRPWNEKKEARKMPIEFSEWLDDFDVLHYRLELTFPLENHWFYGKVHIQAKALQNQLKKFYLHAGGEAISSVLFHGQQIPFTHSEGVLEIFLPYSFSSGDTLSLSIQYEAQPNHIGFYYFDTTAYTMSEPIDARYWFPCKDVPWDKATAELVITVPQGVQVASNGMLLSHTVHPDGQWDTFYWKTNFPMATYLFCVTLSRFYSQWDEYWKISEADSVLCSYYIFKWDSSKAKADCVHLPEAMRIFTQRFGPYPFEKYGMAEAYPFYYAGMEHQTMTTLSATLFRSDLRYEYVFVHELAHSWWGNAVTLRDWPDIWLNEGFATYAEALFVEDFYGTSAFQEKMKASAIVYFNQYEQNDFPLYNPPWEELFNSGIVYHKGAWVLHMLRGVLGDSLFEAVLKNYYAQFRYKNACTNDFQTLCESISQRELDWFFNQWVYGQGYLSITYTDSLIPIGTDSTRILLTLRQGRTGPHFFQMPIQIRCEDGFQRKDTTVWVLDEITDLEWRVPFNVTQIQIDPDTWVLMKAKRGKVEWPSEKEIVEIFPPFPNPVRSITQFTVRCRETKKRPKILCIYNLLGQRVRSIQLSPYDLDGTAHAVWDGKDEKGRWVPSGVYVVTVQGFSEKGRKVVVWR